MLVCRSIDAVREWRRIQRRAERSVGFVPTMGSLHEGHLSLVDAARRRCNAVALSLFVNPTQFGPGEDLDRYPRDEPGDLRLCSERGVDMVFCPDRECLYAPDDSTWVEETRLSRGLCGALRPGHFRGVTTVVTKLFHIVEPTVAVFGQKDAQQAAVIRRVTRDLFLPVDVVVEPIVRDADGLALSSRNRYLTADERRRATGLSHALFTAARRVSKGERSAAAILRDVRACIETSGAESIDYCVICDPDTLDAVDVLSAPALLAVAARYGATRLIDNIILAP